MSDHAENRRHSSDLAAITPAWNERENLELLLPALREVVADLGVSAEIVVVDGGSQITTYTRLAGRWAEQTSFPRDSSDGGRGLETATSATAIRSLLL